MTVSPQSGRLLESTTTRRQDADCTQALLWALLLFSWSGSEACPHPPYQLTWKPAEHSCLRLLRTGHGPAGLKGLLHPSSSTPCSCSLLSLGAEHCSSLQCLLPPGTGCLTLVRPSADPAPYSFINRPISHLALAQSSTPKRQMQPQDFLSSQGQSRTRQQACGPEG